MLHGSTAADAWGVTSTASGTSASGVPEKHARPSGLWREECEHAALTRLLPYSAVPECMLAPRGIPLACARSPLWWLSEGCHAPHQSAPASNCAYSIFNLLYPLQLPPQRLQPPYWKPIPNGWSLLQVLLQGLHWQVLQRCSWGRLSRGPLRDPSLPTAWSGPAQGCCQGAGCPYGTPSLQPAHLVAAAAPAARAHVCLFVCLFVCLH
jgi:hypothetical protein